MRNGVRRRIKNGAHYLASCTVIVLINDCFLKKICHSLLLIQIVYGAISVNCVQIFLTHTHSHVFIYIFLFAHFALKAH